MNPFRISTRLQTPARQRAGGGALESGAPALRSLPDEPAVGASPVPWRVSARSASGVIELEHRGATPLHSVRFSLAGGGMLGLSLPRTVQPGERVRAVLRGADAESALGTADAMLVLRWFEPDGRELLWPIAL